MATLTTPIYGFPYPDGAERVMDGDNAIGALAAAVENALAALGASVPLRFKCSAALTLTTSDVVIPGLSTTITAVANEIVLVSVAFDVYIQTSDPGSVTAGVFIDGVAAPNGGAALMYGTTTNTRATVAGFWLAQLAAGARVIDTRARKGNAGGAAQAQTQSVMVIQRFRAYP